MDERTQAQMIINLMWLALMFGYVLGIITGLMF